MKKILLTTAFAVLMGGTESYALTAKQKCNLPHLSKKAKAKCNNNITQQPQPVTPNDPQQPQPVTPNDAQQQKEEAAQEITLSS